jgi:hypothetical protein
LVVTIIFDPAKPLDSKRAAGLTRHVRSRLTKIGEDSFPLISFISKAEIGKQKTEAA